jgi:hypothetical protein
VIAEILLPPYMTAIAMVARVVTLAMSLGIALALAKIAEEVVPEDRKRRVSVAVALMASLGAPFTYYAHVTNLDVPYLFWAWLAVLSLVRAIVREEPKRIRTAALFTACAVATKDQAYAMFLFALPALVAAWAVADRSKAKAIAKDAVVGGAIAIAMVLVVDGAVTNPSGFKARVAFLGGSASQDFATYSNDWQGRWSVLVDTVKIFQRHYHPVLGVPVVLGLVEAIRTGRRNRTLLATLAPLAIAVSFTIAFNLTARRVEERFTLPQMLAAAFYAGFAIERLWCSIGWVGRASAAVFVVTAAWLPIQVDATMLAEPRYDAEAWLREHAKKGDTIETHGLNVYLSRFPAQARTVRVGPDPADKRNPMPGVEEVQAKLEAIAERNPRFVVVNECYVWRYMERELSGNEGRIVPTTQLMSATDEDATALFRGLFRHTLGYHLARESRITSEVFPRYGLHASLGCPVFVFERD